MAEQTTYIVFEGVPTAAGQAWLAVGTKEATSPKQAIESCVAELAAQGKAAADHEYAACPARNWSGGSVTVENKPTVRAAVTSGYKVAAFPVAVPEPIASGGPNGAELDSAHVPTNV